MNSGIMHILIGALLMMVATVQERCPSAAAEDTVAVINEETPDNSVAIIDFFVTDKFNLNVTTSVALDTDLMLRLTLSGDAYSGLMPYECHFNDGYDKSKKIQFVVDRCPRSNYQPTIGLMQRVDFTSYQVSFKAFSFVTAPVSTLVVSCQLTLCITPTMSNCNESCWQDPEDQPTPKPFRHLRAVKEVGDSERTRNDFGYSETGVASANKEDSGNTLKTISLIVTDKNFTTPASHTTPSPVNSSMLYILYGLCGFFGLLFFILLIGIIVFICCCSSPKSKQSRVVYMTPPPTAGSAARSPACFHPTTPNHQQQLCSHSHPHQIDPVFSNLPGQAPYCDWYTVFRIPRVWTERSKPENYINEIAGGGARTSTGGSTPSTVSTAVSLDPDGLGRLDARKPMGSRSSPQSAVARKAQKVKEEKNARSGSM